MGDIFLITSVINPGNVGWSYVSTRSVYTPQERFEQTLETIKSIRERVSSECKIMLVEGSKLDSEMESILKENVDIFLDLSGLEEVQEACLQTDMKGFGEIIKTRLAVEYIEQHNLEFNRLFKISGRYILNDKFDSTKFTHSSFCFKHGGNYGCTVLYSVPKCLIKEFQDAIRKTQEEYSHGPRSLENTLFLYCNPKSNVETLGVWGKVAVFANDYWEG